VCDLIKLPASPLRGRINPHIIFCSQDAHYAARRNILYRLHEDDEIAYFAYLPVYDPRISMYNYKHSAQVYICAHAESRKINIYGSNTHTHAFYICLSLDLGPEVETCILAEMQFVTVVKVYKF
jgi:hypothetical protein